MDCPSTYITKENSDWSWYGSKATKRILVLRAN